MPPGGGTALPRSYGYCPMPRGRHDGCFFGDGLPGVRAVVVHIPVGSSLHRCYGAHDTSGRGYAVPSPDVIRDPVGFRLGKKRAGRGALYWPLELPRACHRPEFQGRVRLSSLHSTSGSTAPSAFLGGGCHRGYRRFDRGSGCRGTGAESKPGLAHALARGASAPVPLVEYAVEGVSPSRVCLPWFGVPRARRATAVDWRPGRAWLKRTYRGAQYACTRAVGTAVEGSKYMGSCMEIHSFGAVPTVHVCIFREDYESSCT